MIFRTLRREAPSMISTPPGNSFGDPLAEFFRVGEFVEASPILFAGLLRNRNGDLNELVTHRL